MIKFVTYSKVLPANWVVAIDKDEIVIACLIMAYRFADSALTSVLAKCYPKSAKTGRCQLEEGRLSHFSTVSCPWRPCPAETAGVWQYNAAHNGTNQYHLSDRPVLGTMVGHSRDCGAKSRHE